MRAVIASFILGGLILLFAILSVSDINAPQIGEFGGLQFVILGTALIIFTTLINALGVKLMSRINSAGVFIELIAAVLLILLLAVNITRGPDVLLETQGTGEGP